MLNVIRIPGIEIFPCTDVKVKNLNYKGRRKYAREEKSSAEYSVDKELVRVERSIDRENDSYRETVTAIDSGEVLRKVDHPLSEHKGRGSDKPTKK